MNDPRIAFWAHIGGFKFSFGNVLFPGGQAMIPFSQAKIVKENSAYGRAFGMSKFGEKYFNALLAAEKAGKPLDEVSLTAPKEKAAGAKPKKPAGSRKPRGKKKSSAPPPATKEEVPEGGTTQ